MTDYRQLLRYVFVVVAVLLVIGLEVTTARGGRGGGFRGGYRGYRGYRSYRSPSLPSWKTAVIAGTVYYGSRRYMTRRRYINNQAPQICTDYRRHTNASSAQSVVYGKFICPMADQPDDYDYCCGETGKQRCCKFTDDPGRLAGMIIGILLAFALVAGMIFCICYCCLKKKPKTTSHGSIKPNSLGKQPPSMTYDNGTQSLYPATGFNGYPAPSQAPAPPSYDQSGGLPYSANPTGNPYSSNPIGFGEPQAPNYSYSDPNPAVGQGYPSKDGQPPRY